MIYLFVAPFADMIVYENHIEKRVPAGKFSAEVYDMLNKYEEMNSKNSMIKSSERPEQEVKDLLFDNMKLFLHFDTVYYGIISQDTFDEAKAFRLLNDIKQIITEMYKGNVDLMLR